MSLGKTFTAILLGRPSVIVTGCGLRKGTFGNHCCNVKHKQNIRQQRRGVAKFTSIQFFYGLKLDEAARPTV